MADDPKVAAREQSTIGFVYMDLEAAITVAAAMIGAGGVALSRDQLAGVMNLSAGSGNFVTKVATARAFGLIATVGGKYELTNLGFAIVDKDEKRQRAARAESFLNVPLFKRTYEEFKTKQLPPRPHGLEQAFVKFGVAQKQKTNARLAFERSARQAGYFNSGEDRLIEPIVVGNIIPAEHPREDDAVERGTASTAISAASKALHPFIQGLLDALPEPGTNWALEGRAMWLQAAAFNFNLMYKGGEGQIIVSATKITKGQDAGKDGN